MRQITQLKQYTVHEINGILELLRKSYDIVRLVDVEECRLLDVDPNGMLHHGNNCFGIWNRKTRCANCSSFRACLTCESLDKVEHLGNAREMVHSIPIYLELLNGELESCVIECVKFICIETDLSIPEDGSYLSTHDVLTRLYTQEKMFLEIRRRLIEAPDTPYYLVMLNLRNFQLVNRLFGVDVGNRILVGLADLLRQEYTPEEVYGRYRDDRLILFIKKDRFNGERITTHFQKAVQDILHSPIFNIQIKVGVYEIIDPELPIINMIDHAEEAAVFIRDERDRMLAFYEPSMVAKKLKDHQIMTGFQRALDDGEFRIYLQPQVRYDGLILSAEALVRWKRSDGSTFLPGDFLEVLHSSELLSHLDVYVWEKAVKLLQQWTGTELEVIPISINVDPTDFYHVDVPTVLVDLCKKYNVRNNRLRVEITETALIEDIKKQSAMVEKLHQAGFLVEIDDFGKGYSSLSMLKDINADVLKIDMGFLQSTENQHRSRIILNSVIGMANELNMGVITEGVETQEQIDSLNAMGCTNFQGFFYSRPIPVRDFEILAQENLRSHRL